MRWLITLLLTGNLFAQTFAGVRATQRIRVAMVGEGALCEGTVESVSEAGLTMRLKSDTVECGPKGSVVNIAKQSIYQMSSERRLTKGRFMLKLLVGAAAIGAVAALALSGSDPENKLLIANPIVGPAAGYAGSLLVPDAKRYVLLITCPDRFRCFGNPAAPSGNPAPPIER